MPLAAVKRDDAASQQPAVERRAVQHVHHHLTIGPGNGGPGSQATLAFIVGLICSTIVLVLLLAGLVGLFFNALRDMDAANSYALGKIEGMTEALKDHSQRLEERMGTAELTLGLRPPPTNEPDEGAEP